MKMSFLVKSLALSILLFAGLHLTILFSYSALKGDWERINVFRILDLNLFFPDISKGTFSFILSYAFFFLIFFLVLIFFSKSEK